MSQKLINNLFTFNATDIYNTEAIDKCKAGTQLYWHSELISSVRFYCKGTETKVFLTSAGYTLYVPRTNQRFTTTIFIVCDEATFQAVMITTYSVCRHPLSRHLAEAKEASFYAKDEDQLLHLRKISKSSNDTCKHYTRSIHRSVKDFAISFVYGVLHSLSPESYRGVEILCVERRPQSETRSS